MGYKIKAIRLAIKAAKACLKKMIKDVEKSSVIAVLEDIDATLGSLGLDYVVTMEEFANVSPRTRTIPPYGHIATLNWSLLASIMTCYIRISFRMQVLM